MAQIRALYGARNTFYWNKVLCTKLSSNTMDFDLTMAARRVLQSIQTLEECLPSKRIGKYIQFEDGHAEPNPNYNSVGSAQGGGTRLPMGRKRQGGLPPSADITLGLSPKRDQNV